MSVYFNASRDKEYDRGGEEILKYDRMLINAGNFCWLKLSIKWQHSGEGLNPDSGVFTCPVGGTYMFMVHLATHKDKKALLSLRKNGMDIASIINQDGKNKGNHMMGQCVLMELDQGDEVRSSWGLELIPTDYFFQVYVYTFTGTWTADWPHIHFTQFVGN